MTKHSVFQGRFIFYFLSAFALILICYRFINGLGAVTNLTDQYPWGLWVSIDILAGIALASGGFVIAGAIHFFGGHKFDQLYRVSLLTALLGYILFLIGLIVDLGRPWNILHVILSGNKIAPLYEISWCVMFYTFVLILEFLPILFEKRKMV